MIFADQRPNFSLLTVFRCFQGLGGAVSVIVNLHGPSFPALVAKVRRGEVAMVRCGEADGGRTGSWKVAGLHCALLATCLSDIKILRIF